MPALSYDFVPLLHRYARKGAPMTLTMLSGEQYSGCIAELDLDGWARFLGEANSHVMINTRLVEKVELGTADDRAVA